MSQRQKAQPVKEVVNRSNELQRLFVNFHYFFTCNFIHTCVSGLEYNTNVRCVSLHCYFDCFFFFVSSRVSQEGCDCVKALKKYENGIRDHFNPEYVLLPNHEVQGSSDGRKDKAG